MLNNSQVMQKGMELLEKVESLKAQTVATSEHLQNYYGKTITGYYEDIKALKVASKSLAEELYDHIIDYQYIEESMDITDEEWNTYTQVITSHGVLEDLIEYYEEHIDMIEKMTKWTCLPW